MLVWKMQLVFRALADPTRRRLLDLLFERDGRTLTELESELPMTRFGVMKHLRLLEEAGLIATRKVGREKLHYLNPVPIQLISDRWLSKYSAARASALVDLKTALEGGNAMATDSKPRLVYQIIIKAPQERVWEAITKPEFTSRYYYGSTLKTDLAVGSPFTYHMPNGSPIVEGEVVTSEPPSSAGAYLSLPLAPDERRRAHQSDVGAGSDARGRDEGHRGPRGLPGRDGHLQWPCRAAAGRGSSAT